MDAVRYASFSNSLPQSCCRRLLQFPCYRSALSQPSQSYKTFALAADTLPRRGRIDNVNRLSLQAAGIDWRLNRDFAKMASRSSLAFSSKANFIIRGHYNNWCAHASATLASGNISHTQMTSNFGPLPVCLACTLSGRLQSFLRPSRSPQSCPQTALQAVNDISIGPIKLQSLVGR